MLALPAKQTPSLQGPCSPSPISGTAQLPQRWPSPSLPASFAQQIFWLPSAVSADQRACLFDLLFRSPPPAWQIPPRSTRPHLGEEEEGRRSQNEEERGISARAAAARWGHLGTCGAQPSGLVPLLLSLMTDRACLCASSLLATFPESLDAGGTWPCSGWWLSSSPCWCSGRAGCPRRWSSLVFSASPAGWPRGPQAFPCVLPKLCPESAAPEDAMSQTTVLLDTLRCPVSVPKHSGGAERCFLYQTMPSGQTLLADPPWGSLVACKE